MVAPVIGAAVIGGLSSLAGSLFSGSQSKQSARAQMAFQERMSSTSYQRSMKDMRKAGLNPILAYQKGGASTPGGAGFSYPDIGKAAGTATAAATTALQAVRQKQELRNMRAVELKDKATTELTATQRWVAKQEFINKQWIGNILRENLTTAQTQALSSRLDAALLRSSLGSQSKILKMFNPLGSSAAQMGRILK